MQWKLLFEMHHFHNTGRAFITHKWSTLTLLTELSHVSTDTSTFPIDAVTMTVAIRNLTFIMPKTALLALPPWVTLTFPIDIFPTLAAQNRTYTCKPSRAPPRWL
jgi:hypothetical protein